MKEIGSEFWWDGKIAKIKNLNSQYFLNDYSDIVYTTTGRGAIDYLIEELNLKKRKILLPSYICESVVLPFAKAKCELDYYDLDLDLSPNFKSSINLSNYDAILHLGYFGFKTNSIMDQILTDKLENTIIIEDITHSLFTDKPKNSNYFIGSIRKWLGVPSGGFVASNKKMDDSLKTGQKDFINLRKEALLEKNKYINSSNTFNKTFLNKFNKAETIIDEDVSSYEIDEISHDIIRNYDYKELIYRRRENFKYLLSNIKETSDLKFVFNNMETEVCPMFFPLYVNNRDIFKNFLIQNKIYCPIHWPNSNQVSNISQNVEYIYNHIISIPCDQRYDIKDMQRIVEIVNLWNTNRSC